MDPSTNREIATTPERQVSAAHGLGVIDSSPGGELDRLFFPRTVKPPAAFSCSTAIVARRNLRAPARSGPELDTAPSLWSAPLVSSQTDARESENCENSRLRRLGRGDAGTWRRRKVLGLNQLRKLRRTDLLGCRPRGALDHEVLAVEEASNILRSQNPASNPGSPRTAFVHPTIAHGSCIPQRSLPGVLPTATVTTRQSKWPCRSPERHRPHGRDDRPPTIPNAPRWDSARWQAQSRPRA